MALYLILAAVVVLVLLTRFRPGRRKQRSSEISGIDALMQWSEQHRLTRWRAYAHEDQAPAEPVQSYKLVGADKTAREDGIRFECRWYRWDALAQTSNGSGAWRPLTDKQPPTSEPLPESETYPTDTPIDQLAEAWADFSLRVARINEAHYLNWQRERERHLEEVQAYAREKIAPLLRRREAQAVADLLPNVGASVDPFADEQPQAQSARRRGSR